MKKQTLSKILRSNTVWLTIAYAIVQAVCNYGPAFMSSHQEVSQYGTAIVVVVSAIVKGVQIALEKK